MTIEEFNNTEFTGRMVCFYKEKEYAIVSVDLGEKLIAIYETDDYLYDENISPDWKRCENITIIK